ncbi:MAG: divalent-cation tolerance protein CutA [Leptospira sp.]|nr:divalent-cation tolerance protein CutA [Leptospira sp.]
MTDSQEIILFTAINDEDLAEILISELLEAQLIVSGTIFPDVRVMYLWDGKLQADSEFKLLLKTKEVNYAAVEEHILKKHPYQFPEIIKINAQFGTDSFKKFVTDRSKKT